MASRETRIAICAEPIDRRLTPNPPSGRRPTDPLSQAANGTERGTVIVGSTGIDPSGREKARLSSADGRALKPRTIPADQ